MKEFAMNWCCLRVTGEPRVSSLFPPKNDVRKVRLGFADGFIGEEHADAPG